MKKRSFRVVIALALTLALGVGALFAYPAIDSAAVGSAAPDVPSEWAAEQVNAAIAAGLVPAPMQSKYTQAATRAEFAALSVALYESLKGEITDRKTFADTTDANAEKAAAIGVTAGANVDGTMFMPDETLTREQAATMLNRLAATLDSPLTGHGQGAGFDDGAAISDWAVGAVNQVQASGIMQGVGENRFDPQGAYTREQSVITIMRLRDMINGSTPNGSGELTGDTETIPSSDPPQSSAIANPQQSGAIANQQQAAGAVDESITAPVAPASSEAIYYWTPNGKSHHSTTECWTLSRSKTILSGTLEQALAAGKNDPCDVCVG